MSNFPTIKEVVAADREQICRWWRFLPPPSNSYEHRVMCLVNAKFRGFGGFTPELFRKIDQEENSAAPYPEKRWTNPLF